MNDDLRTDAQTPGRAPDCFRCRHFRITWEPAYPRSCRIFGFKTRSVPSAEVFLSTGKHCFSFEAREGKTEGQIPDSFTPDSGDGAE